MNNHQTDYERRKNLKIFTYSTYKRLGSVNAEEFKTTVLVEEIIIISFLTTLIFLTSARRGK